MMRTIILSPDWNAVLFWHEASNRKPADETALALSDELRREMRVYYESFAELFLRGLPGTADATELRLLDERGVLLWQRLQKELADYRITFYSHELQDEFETLNVFRIAQQAAR